MIYYHGTDRYFEEFVLNKSRTYMDFGSGIYLSEKLDHAKRVALWKNGEHAYVYTYKINLTEVTCSLHLPKNHSLDDFSVEVGASRSTTLTRRVSTS